MINATSLNLTPEEAYEVLKPLLIFIAGMVIYAIFIFKFYQFVARRDVFKLNLAQYSKSAHPAMAKFLGGLLYLLEHIVLLPLFTFFWFGFFTILLIFLTKEQTVQNILLISIALISAVRITAYYNEDLSKDLAKMVPFALLGLFLVDISYFNFSGSVSTIKQILPLWKSLFYYLIFVIILEIVLRISHGFVSLFKKEKS